jgi:hypothetical protein
MTIHRGCIALANRITSKAVRRLSSHRGALVNLIDQRPADDVVRALREVVSHTFEEMHSEEQHEEVLRRIRHRIGSILPAFNDLLDEIEIEPIAEVSRLNEGASTNAPETDSVDDGSTNSSSMGDKPVLRASRRSSCTS